MKTLNKLVLRAFFTPFFGTFFSMIFVLLMQNVWKYIDDLIGKGLEWSVILEIIIYIIPTLVPLALPLAILLSSIMTFGQLSENNEITALKSSGISLYKIMRPLFFLVCIFTIAAFLFSNHIIPYSNLKFKTLLYDVINKKLDLNIREGIFFNDIEGYSIKVAKKESGNKKLKDILIYDHSDKIGNNKVIAASSGLMYTSKNNHFLILELYNGYSYEDIDSKNSKKRNELPFTTIKFKSKKIRFDLTSFNFERSEEAKYSNIAQFMNLKQLTVNYDSLSKVIDLKLLNFQKKITSLYHINNDTSLSILPLLFTKDILNKKNTSKLIKSSTNTIRSTKSYIYNTLREIKYKNYKQKKIKIEWHRKYTLSFACIILFMIGAPLGAIIKKGGLGFPVLTSIIFFLLYHIISITAEKSALQGVISSSLGMWLSTIVLTPIGIFFSINAANDLQIFRNNWFKIVSKIKYLCRKKS